MKRDMDLIRSILLKLEEENKSTVIHSLIIEGYDMATVAYHCKIMQEAGFISAYKGHYADNELQGFSIGSLTWAGQDYFEKVRDNSRWGKIKKLMKEKGLPATIEVVKMLADGIISAATSTAINRITGE